MQTDNGLFEAVLARKKRKCSIKSIINLSAPGHSIASGAGIGSQRARLGLADDSKLAPRVAHATDRKNFSDDAKVSNPTQVDALSYAIQTRRVTGHRVKPQLQ